MDKEQKDGEIPRGDAFSHRDLSSTTGYRVPHLVTG